MTVDGTTYPMPVPFLVIATQNPIEYEGTFALPEAQLDRFMLRLRMGYPQPLEEVVILDEQKRGHPLDAIEEVASVADLRRDAGRRARDLRRLRPCPTTSSGWSTPRGSTRTSTSAPRRAARWRSIAPGQAFAALAGRDYVIPDDIKQLAEPALAHRLIIKTAATIRDVDPGAIVRELPGSVPVEAQRPVRSGAGSSRPDGRLWIAPRADPTMIRRLEFVIVAAVLVIGAFSTGRGLRLLPRLPRHPGRRRRLRADTLRAVRPGGRLLARSAACAGRGRAARHVHGAQHEPAAEALAGGPQPVHAADPAARSCHRPRSAVRALVGRAGAADASRPLPDRADDRPHRRPVRTVRVVRLGRLRRRR